MSFLKTDPTEYDENCKNCGAPRNPLNHKCAHCGTAYPSRYAAERPPVGNIGWLPPFEGLMVSGCITLCTTTGTRGRPLYER